MNNVFFCFIFPTHGTFLKVNKLMYYLFFKQMIQEKRLKSSIRLANFNVFFLLFLIISMCLLQTVKFCPDTQLNIFLH